MSDKKQIGIAIRFIHEWRDAPDPEDARAWALVVQDTRDVPVLHKYAQAREFLRERREGMG